MANVSEPLAIVASAIESANVLTGDVGGGGKLLGHFGVHRDHELSFLRHLGIALFDLVGDPVLELLAGHCSHNVDDPLLWRLGQVNWVGQVLDYVRVVLNLFHDLLDGQALVLGDMEVLDLVVLNVALLLVEHVLQEVNGDVVWRKRRVRIMESKASHKSTCRPCRDYSCHR